MRGRECILDCGGRSICLGGRTLIMGILNVTPDSFSDGGKYSAHEAAINHALEMQAAGADIIDIGGESTRPGSRELDAAEELERIIPVIGELAGRLTVPISVDTYKAEVAREAVRAGAGILNDVWGLQRDPDMASVAAGSGLPVVIMHNRQGSEYKRDMMDEVVAFLLESVRIAVNAGVKEENIILDPGVGFGKTLEHNLTVMNRLEEFCALGYHVLLGTSRKSMIGKVLDLPPEERLEGTIATTVMGVMKGVDIIRVHDVEANRRAMAVTEAVIREGL